MPDERATTKRGLLAGTSATGLLGARSCSNVQPFDAPGVPSPAECPGMLGPIVGLVGGIVGTVWLLFYDGSIPSFVPIAVSALVRWVSFMYCEVWEQSLPVSRGSG